MKKTTRDEDIAAEARQGTSHSQLARKYGVSETRIGQILRRNHQRRVQEADRNSIGSLGLSTRAVNGLTALGIGTVVELEGMSREELARAKNLGAGSIAEIADALRRRGLYLRGEGPTGRRKVTDVEALLGVALQDARELAQSATDHVRAGQLQELAMAIENATRLAKNLREPL